MTSEDLQLSDNRVALLRRLNRAVANTKTFDELKRKVANLLNIELTDGRSSD